MILKRFWFQKKNINKKKRDILFVSSFSRPKGLSWPALPLQLAVAPAQCRGLAVTVALPPSLNLHRWHRDPLSTVVTYFASSMGQTLLRLESPAKGNPQMHVWVNLQKRSRPCAAAVSHRAIALIRSRRGAQPVRRSRRRRHLLLHRRAYSPTPLPSSECSAAAVALVLRRCCWRRPPLHRRSWPCRVPCRVQEAPTAPEGSVPSPSVFRTLKPPWWVRSLALFFTVLFSSWTEAWNAG
jgi:hypothetical protein